MKLAFISLMAGQPYGGSEVLWSKVAYQALEKGHQVAVSGYDWGNDTHPVYRELEEKGAQVFLRPRFFHHMSLYTKIKSYLRNRYPRFKNDWKFITELNPDHILISQGACFDLVQHNYFLYELMLEKGFGYSILSHNHPQFSYIPDSNVFPGGASVFLNAVSTFFISKRQQHVTEKAIGVMLENAIFTWNPLNLDDNKYIEWPDSDVVEMAIVAGLISGKGHDIAFEVLSSKVWKSRNWKLNIYGSGYGESYLKQLAEEYGIHEKVFFHGHVQNIQSVWRTNHILLIPSSGEGLPISLVEAMVAGRPSVVTDVGGITEIVEEGLNGFVAEAPTVFSFSNAMERAWSKRHNWIGMGKECHKSIFSEIDTSPENTLLERILLKP